MRFKQREEEIDMEKTVEIFNESGLHARPAALFVKTASKYKSEIIIE